MTTNNDTLAPNGKRKIRVVGLYDDGNVFFIMGKVTREMKRAGWTKDEIDAFMKTAQSGDYDNALRVTMSYADEVYADDEEINDDR